MGCNLYFVVFFDGMVGFGGFVDFFGFVGGSGLVFFMGGCSVVFGFGGGLIGLVGSLLDGLGVFLIFVYSLVKDIVVLEIFVDEEIVEDFVEVIVVWFVVEVE